MTKRQDSGNVTNQYIKSVVEARMEANKMLTKADYEMTPELQDKFRRVLTYLVREMESMYPESPRVERPEALREMDDYNMRTVGFNKCKRILRSIKRLQDDLGYTMVHDESLQDNSSLGVQ